MTGEERHERCRYGELTKAWEHHHDWRGPREKPTVIPLCAWQVPEPCPPAVKRAWGGNAIETKDCEGCPAYDPL